MLQPSLATCQKLQTQTPTHCLKHIISLSRIVNNLIHTLRAKESQKTSIFCSCLSPPLYICLVKFSSSLCCHRMCVFSLKSQFKESKIPLSDCHSVLVSPPIFCSTTICSTKCFMSLSLFLSLSHLKRSVKGFPSLSPEAQTRTFDTLVAIKHSCDLESEHNAISLV